MALLAGLTAMGPVFNNVHWIPLHEMVNSQAKVDSEQLI